jgi:3-methyladenine DNA glycosylase AlkD
VTFDAEGAAAELAEALRPLGTPERAVQEKRYLKSELEFLGVSIPDIRRAVRAALRTYPELDRQALLAWAQALWLAPVHETRTAAIEVLQLGVRLLTASDLASVEQLIRDSRTWALVDPLAVNVAGRIAAADQAAWAVIDGWALDYDFWVRRSALLAVLPGVRATDLNVQPRFAGYAEPMLSEKEFFIRKAIGWVLREISLRDPDWVVAWTEQHLNEMSGVTFREAVRRLPAPHAERLRSSRA